MSTVGWWARRRRHKDGTSVMMWGRRRSADDLRRGSRPIKVLLRGLELLLRRSRRDDWGDNGTHLVELLEGLDELGHVARGDRRRRREAPAPEEGRDEVRIREREAVQSSRDRRRLGSGIQDEARMK